MCVLMCLCVHVHALACMCWTEDSLEIGYLLHRWVLVIELGSPRTFTL